MLSYSLIGGLGELRPGSAAGSGALIPTSPTLVRQAGEGVVADMEGMCSADSKLIFTGGAWRVRAPDEQCGAVNTGIDSAAVMASQKIFVGSFALDPKATDGEITVFNTPAQVPQAGQMGAWLVQAMQQAYNAAIAQNDPSISSPVGKPFPCTSFAENPTSATAILSASGIISNTRGVDTSGFPCHFAQYAGDPNTYTWYDLCDWMPVIQPGQALPFQIPGGLLQTFQNFKDAGNAEPTLAMHPPIAKFIHPTTGETWGMWIGLALDAPSTPYGGWNSASDRPNGYHLEVGFTKIPDAPWYKAILEVIFFIPALIFSAAVDIVVGTLSLLEGLSCDVLRTIKPGVAIPGPNGPIVAAADQIAQALLSCGPPKPPPLTIPIALPTPWWQTWWAIAAFIAAGVGGLLIIRARSAAKT